MDSDTWDRRYASADLIWSAGPNRWVEEAAAELPAGRALDLAAGEGRNALWLQIVRAEPRRRDVGVDRQVRTAIDAFLLARRE